MKKNFYSLLENTKFTKTKKIPNFKSCFHATPDVGIRFYTSLLPVSSEKKLKKVNSLDDDAMKNAHLPKTSGSAKEHARK